MNPECDCRGVKHFDAQGRFVKCDDCGLSAQHIKDGPTLWSNSRTKDPNKDMAEPGFQGEF